MGTRLPAYEPMLITCEGLFEHGSHQSGLGTLRVLTRRRNKQLLCKHNSVGQRLGIGAPVTNTGSSLCYQPILRRSTLGSRGACHAWYPHKTQISPMVIILTSDQCCPRFSRSRASRWERRNSEEIVLIAVCADMPTTNLRENDEVSWSGGLLPIRGPHRYARGTALLEAGRSLSTRRCWKFVWRDLCCL